MTDKPSMDVFEARKLTRYPYSAIILGILMLRVLAILPTQLVRFIQKRLR